METAERLRREAAQYLAMAQGREPMPGYLSTTECLRRHEALKAQVTGWEDDEPTTNDEFDS